MNPRIKELAVQARKEYLKMPTGYRPEQVGMYRELMEKFAELIVQECIDKITTYDLVPGHSAKWEGIYDIHARLLQDLGEELKNHFGVKHD